MSDKVTSPRVLTKEWPGTRSFLDTVNKIQKVALTPDTGWIRVGISATTNPDYEISPPFENGWDNVGGTNSPPMSFYLSASGEVRLRGNIEGGSSGTTIFTLPSGFRPEFTERFSIPKDDLGGTSTIEINPNGEVIMIA